MSRKGFTLLEVLIVIIIIGILAAIALPQYTKTLEKAKSAEAIGILGSLRAAMDRYWYDQVSIGSYTQLGNTGIATLDIDDPNTTHSEWAYIVRWDGGTNTARNYVLKASRDDYWVEIDEEGNMAKSSNLGGGGTALVVP